MSEILHDDAVLDERRIKTRRLIFKYDVDSTCGCCETHLISGVPSTVVVVRIEGDTATADAIDCPADCVDCWANTYTAPSNSTGVVGFLLDISALESGSQSVREVLGVSLLRGNNPLFACGAVDEHDIIALLGEDVIDGLVTSATGVTLSGNIAFELTSTVNFESADYTQVFEVIYILA